MTRWKRQPDARPGQIVTAALDVFAEKGFRAATMEQVAEAAGITKGTIYLYFRSKRDLFLEVVRSEVERLLAVLPLVGAVSPEQYTEESARLMGRAFLDALMSPRVVKMIPLVMGELHTLSDFRTLYQEEVLPRANRQFAALLEGRMEQGAFRRLDPNITARCLLGMFFIFTLTQEVFGARRVTPMDSAAIVDTIIDIFFHGVSAQGGAV